MKWGQREETHKQIEGAQARAPTKTFLFQTKLEIAAERNIELDDGEPGLVVSGCELPIAAAAAAVLAANENELPETAGVECEE